MFRKRVRKVEERRSRELVATAWRRASARARTDGAVTTAPSRSARAGARATARAWRRASASASTAGMAPAALCQRLTRTPSISSAGLWCHGHGWLERRAVRGASLSGQLLEPRPVREPRRESDGRSPLVSSPTCHPVCELGTCTRHGERASCACFEGWQGVRCEEPSLPIELSSAWSVHGARMCLLEPVHVFLYSCIINHDVYHDISCGIMNHDTT
jgi:hypothetical protein